MQAWYLCRNPDPLVPQEVLDSVDSVRDRVPNKYCDPQVAARLHACATRSGVTPASTAFTARAPFISLRHNRRWFEATEKGIRMFATKALPRLNEVKLAPVA